MLRQKILCPNSSKTGVEEKRWHHFLLIAHKVVLLTFSLTCICPLGKIPIFQQVDIFFRSMKFGISSTSSSTSSRSCVVREMSVYTQSPLQILLLYWNKLCGVNQEKQPIFYCQRKFLSFNVKDSIKEVNLTFNCVSLINYVKHGILAEWKCIV